MNFDIKYIILWGFIIVNIVTFILFGIDKYKAKKGKMRISERTLLTWCVLGPFGGYVGMYQFRHKYKKFRFQLILFVMCLVQFAAFFAISYFMK
ncbi:MAG: DUF1294 domain-containing protein [Oscillospiraceae bacterium]|nr:DUF1294 domain-containing protein [Oscillospiraceae bacterium]MBR2503911.1 DUF1294 domain-containing protein [Oscillospiraceae bacterium]